MGLRALFLLGFLFLFPTPGFSMHIMEGFLPVGWSAVWALVAAPMVFFGALSIKRTIQHSPKVKILLGLAGAYVFVLSALKIPSVTGSSSHPAGVGLGAILFGVGPMVVLGLIVLLFQALLLAHGGLTTLGANAFSLAVTGPLVSWALFRALKQAKVPFGVCVFCGAFAGSIATYLVTAMQLALAFPAQVGGVWVSMIKFSSVFAVTQVPLAATEGFFDRGGGQSAEEI